MYIFVRLFYINLEGMETNLGKILRYLYTKVIRIMKLYKNV